MGRRACKDFLFEFIHCRAQQQDTEQTVDDGRDTGQQFNGGADDFREGLRSCFCKKNSSQDADGNAQQDRKGCADDGGQNDVENAVTGICSGWLPYCAEQDLCKSHLCKGGSTV